MPLVCIFYSINYLQNEHQCNYVNLSLCIFKSTLFTIYYIYNGVQPTVRGIVSISSFVYNEPSSKNMVMTSIKTLWNLDYFKKILIWFRYINNFLCQPMCVWTSCVDVHHFHFTTWHKEFNCSLCASSEVQVVALLICLQ